MGDKTSITIHTRKMLISKVNIPKEIILKGKLIIFNKGFIKQFANPNIMPDKTIISIEPSNLTPGTIRIARKIPKIAITM